MKLINDGGPRRNWLTAWNAADACQYVFLVNAADACRFQI